MGRIKHKWIEIFIQLDIPRDVLKQFEKDSDPFSAAMDYWLKGNMTESAVPITWKSIADALRSAHVGEPALAEEISKKYCQKEDGG